MLEQRDGTGHVDHEYTTIRPMRSIRADSGGSGEPSAETVEVAHEELLRRWSRLGQWVNADRKFLQWRARLAPLIDEHRRDPESALLRHGALREARQYYPVRQAEMEGPERKFVEASVRAERLRVVEGDPTARTAFVRDAVHWPIHTRELAASLRNFQDSEVRSGLCLALGGVDRSRWTKEELGVIQEQLLRMYQEDPDAGVHSAAGWALPTTYGLGKVPDHDALVVRGGAYSNGNCSSDERLKKRASYGSLDTGFRVCLVPGPVAVSNPQSRKSQPVAE